MTAPDPSSVGASIDWDAAAPGAEFSATVIMASGFALPEGQRVRERYRVASKLGKGGMGQVLEVSLVGGDDHQSYALKVVARPAPDEAHDAAARIEADKQARWFADLLRQEAAKQDVVQRHGVSVARLFALVQLDDGSLGLRMEIARGRSLETRIDYEAARPGARPDVHFAVVASRKLMTQLRRLHEVSAPGSPFGFIHSDIKPGNVFLDDHDESDPLITLLDFGVATAGQAMTRGLSGSHGGRKTLVLEQAGGTIGYAPPGHFAGAPTPLSDVFAAMVILYELITGDMPWDFTGVRRNSEDLARVEALMRTRPRRVGEVRPSVPIDLADALDAFFTREFGALQTLSDLAPAALDAPDEAVQRAMVERLSVLARDYQGKLDELLAVLATRGPSPAASAADARGVNTRPSARPTLPSAPGSEGAATGDPPRRPRTPVASRADTMLARAPARRARGGGLSWLLLLVLVGSGAYYYYANHPRSVRTPELVPPRAPGDASGATDAVALRLPLPDVIAVVAGDARAPDASAIDASIARPCECVADAPGTLVVAHGGALAHDVVLCAASTVVVDAGIAQFVGRGTIPPEVVAAFPELSCRVTGIEGERPAQRSASSFDGVALFRCRLPRRNEDAGPPLFLTDAGGQPDTLAARTAPDATAPGDASTPSDAGPSTVPPVPPDAGPPSAPAPAGPAAHAAPRRAPAHVRRAPARRRHHGGGHRRGRRRRR